MREEKNPMEYPGYPVKVCSHQFQNEDTNTLVMLSGLPDDRGNDLHVRLVVPEHTHLHDPAHAAIVVLEIRQGNQTFTIDVQQAEHLCMFLRWIMSPGADGLESALEAALSSLMDGPVRVSGLSAVVKEPGSERGQDVH